MPLLSSDLTVSSFLTDNSVKIAWDRKDWDFGTKGTVDDAGNASGFSTNWVLGTDSNGRLVLGQANIGNNNPEVSQNGVTLTQLDDTPRLEANVGQDERWLPRSYIYNLSPDATYTWAEAMGLSHGPTHLAIINNAAENSYVQGLTGGYSVWLGGTDVNGTTHSAWWMHWVDGTYVDQSTGYSNFRYDQPDNAGAYGDEDQLMMWPDGTWNDYNGVHDYELHAIWETEPHWSAVELLPVQQRLPRLWGGLHA